MKKLSSWVLGSALCALLFALGCTTPSGKYGRPINPADGTDTAAALARVVSLESSRTTDESSINTLKVTVTNMPAGNITSGNLSVDRNKIGRASCRERV